MTNRRHVNRGLFLAGIAFIAMATPAFAQEMSGGEQPPSNEQATGNEIVVTATKRNQTIQDVPFSINAQTAEDIQRTGATSLESVARNVAGLTVQNLGPGQSQVSVRGVSAGQIVRDQPGVMEQVGIYLDESVISLSLFTPDFDLFDLNRIETLRGPQGTLFGAGSVGGTVRYITNQPKIGITEGAIETGASVLQGGDVGYDLKGMINLPLGDTAALRAVAYGEHFPGFINAIGPAAGKNINDGERYGGRVSLLWEPAAGISIVPRLVYQDVKANGFNRQDKYNLYYNPLINPSDTLPDRTQYLKLREQFRDKTTLADLTANVAIGDNLNLTSVTSYIHRNILVSRDASALTGSVGISPLASIGVDPDIANLPSNLLDGTKLDQWTQELRLASTGNGPFQWVFGGFYSNVKRKYEQRLPTPGYDAFIDAALGAGVSAAVSNGFPADSPYNADIPYSIKQQAVFGEASYQFGKFKLTAGGRYYDYQESRDFISGGLFSNGDNRIGDKTSSNGFTPRVIASFEPTKDLTFNLQASKGFRLGGVNDPLNIPLCAGGANGIDAQTYGNHPTYNDETLWNYEAGIKASGRGLMFNAAVFYNDISNLQVTADAGSCSSRVVFNVPKAHSQGVEMELSATPTKGLDLSLAGSLISSKFDSTVTTADGSAVIAGIRKGNRLPTVPKFQMSATGTYTTELTDRIDWSFTASFQHVGDRITQPADQEPGAGSFTNSIYYDPNTGAYGTGAYNFGSYNLPAYNLVNLSTGFDWRNGLSIIVYIDNVFDENPLLSLDRERGGRARLGYNIGMPRKIGVTLRKTF